MKSLSAVCFTVFLFTLVSCDKSRLASEPAKLRFESIIPKPVSSQMDGNAFILTADTKIHSTDNSLQGSANILADILRSSTGFDIPVENSGQGSEDLSIRLELAPGGNEAPEGYTLTVEEDRILISGNSPIGVFWGVQTLRQLLPESVEKGSLVREASWEIATGTIRDAPEYAWRGSMLDVARHFFTVDDVKRYIDMISLYKMNTLHLHLSDDQGWRIEIKSWPDLTRVGGKTEVGGGEGGYYTQEDYAEIIDYAARRYITVVPEIDMPGHINAALVSYADLNPGPSINREPGGQKADTPIPGVVYTGIKVGFSTLDIRKEVTFRFVNDVLREMAAMTPGPYLHIGGDEAAVTKKQDYIAFINRFKEIVEANGKKMIGWEEIAQGNIDSSVIVQHWHSQEYARMAAEKGATLIYSPAKKVYLDMQYDSTTKLGLHWAAYVEVDSSYLWDPATHVPGVDARLIKGVEAPLWSETLETLDDIEYMLFPRLPGVAEVGWTASDARDWNDYRQRLAQHAKRWDVMGIDYYRSPKVPWDKAEE